MVHNLAFQLSAMKYLFRWLGSDQEMVCLDMNVICRLWSRLRVRGFILESLIKLYVLHCVTPDSLFK